MRWTILIVLGLVGGGVGVAWSLPRQAPSTVSIASATVGTDLGRRTYALCQGCHQVGGNGVPSLYPTLIQGSRTCGPPVLAIAAVLDGGRTSSSPTPMPPFRDRLNDDEIAAVLTYVRSSWGNHADAVTSTEVRAVRTRSGATP